MAATAANILASLRSDFDAFGAEATAIRESLAEVPGAYFYMSLYALLMGAFSLVDLHSTVWAAGSKSLQTGRMRAYLDRYSGRDPRATILAIQLYRHTLMHTSRPRMLMNKHTGEAHAFLLHWGRKRADESAHYTVNGQGKLTLNLECLVEDLSGALDRFVAEASTDVTLCERIERLWPRIMVQRFEP